MCIYNSLIITMQLVVECRLHKQVACPTRTLASSCAVAHTTSPLVARFIVLPSSTGSRAHTHTHRYRDKAIILQQVGPEFIGLPAPTPTMQNSLGWRKKCGCPKLCGILSLKRERGGEEHSVRERKMSKSLCRH